MPSLKPSHFRVQLQILCTLTAAGCSVNGTRNLWFIAKPVLASILFLIDRSLHWFSSINKFDKICNSGSIDRRVSGPNKFHHGDTIVLQPSEPRDGNQRLNVSSGPLRALKKEPSGHKNQTESGETPQNRARKSGAVLVTLVELGWHYLQLLT